MDDPRRGVLYALLTYTIWGVIPVYFKWVEFASPWEVLAHRIVWSVAILICLISVRSQWRTLLGLSVSDIRWLCLSALLLTVNWGTYIWALQNGRIVETSLGYYINPLISVVLGVLFLNERLRPAQMLAVGLASLGVINEIAAVGILPWAGLVLAFSFGFYGLVRKKIAVDSAVGLGVESAVLAPFAIAWLVYLALSNTNTGIDEPERLGLLALGGLVTVVPLVFFAAAALRLNLTTIGLFQYVAPTITLGVAYAIYDTAVTGGQWITFSLIWLGLVLFSVEGLYQQRRKVVSGV
jgi:chloramphenicol-sensitive protein RarD